MELNKYYMPEIEEFHVGFEYERFVPRPNINEEECWEKIIMSVNYLSLDDIDNEIIEKEIRVKYLDREDIESLGFNDFKHSVADWYKLEKRVPDGYCHYGYWNCFRLVHEYTNHKVKIIAYEYNFEEKDEFVLFQGSCKNKSELIKLLKQLGINDTE